MIVFGVMAQIPPTQIITRNTSFEQRVYQMPAADDPNKPAIEVRGNNIVVDFHNATLEGTPQTTEPDQRKGIAVVVHGNNVTIKNVTIRGYKQGIYAENCKGLKVLDCDLSYNYKPHLASTLDKEDLSDWMSYHHNDNQEWLLGDKEYRDTNGRSGNPPKWPALYLDGCDNFEVKAVKANGGQNALMLNRSNKGLVWNCDLSFNSGVGLGMYRSSDNRIMHNKIDWCVRGFSYGVYNRGQDSAGILIYEQSSRNTFAYNSVTHGGDGFFLWAGQTTMDTGQGGCNDNLLYANDFSHAPTNGIEATFSRNQFVNNLILECWHGIWGGYGYDSKVLGNVFGHNAEAIAWEHGQNNLVLGNTFTADNEGINIWSNPQQDPNWGYAKKRDTRSRDWTITNNGFLNETTNALHVRRSQNIKFTDNKIALCGGVVKNDGEVTGLVTDPNNVVAGAPAPPTSSMNQGQITSVDSYLKRFDVAWDPMAKPVSGNRMADPLPNGQDAFLKPGTLRGWRYIFVDEWGPYDFKRPLLWPRENLAAKSSVATDKDGKQIEAGSKTQRFEILGPKGTWKLLSSKNATLSSTSGSVPGTVDVETPLYGSGTVDIQLEYTGAATTDYRGIETPAGQPVRFGYNKFFAPIDWTIRFYKWTKPSNPSDAHATPDEEALQAIFKGQPLKELKKDKIDFAGSSFDPLTGNDHFATMAEGTFTVNPGDYVLELTTDDGARLWLDGKPLIEDAWHYQGPTLYAKDIHLDGGKHTIRLEHFQIDGYAALKVNLRPKK